MGSAVTAQPFPEAGTFARRAVDVRCHRDTDGTAVGEEMAESRVAR